MKNFKHSVAVIILCVIVLLFYGAIASQAARLIDTFTPLRQEFL